MDLRWDIEYISKNARIASRTDIYSPHEELVQAVQPDPSTCNYQAPPPPAAILLNTAHRPSYARLPLLALADESTVSLLSCAIDKLTLKRLQEGHTHSGSLNFDVLG
jgi:hypothetical protein